METKTRYLFKRGEQPKHVYVWTEPLAERSDMIECDVDGHPLDDQPPLPKKSPGVDFVGLDPQAKTYVQPGHVEESALQISDPIEPPAPTVLDGGDSFGELRDSLLKMRATDIRLKIKKDFKGAKVPAGLSKVALAEHYIEMARP